jgi:hypothetical protein
MLTNPVNYGPEASETAVECQESLHIWYVCEAVVATDEAVTRARCVGAIGVILRWTLAGV